MEEAGSLQHKFLCRDHFLPTDFVTPEGIRLNRMAVPRGLASASHSIPQSSPPLLPTLSNPQPSAVSPKNSNLPVLPPLPLTSELPPEEYNLQVLPPLRTYSKLPLSSTRIETPLPIHTDGPSTSSPISVPNPKQAAANIFSVEDTSLSLSLDSSTASDGEFGCFSDQNSSSKPRTRRSLLKELNLAKSDLTPRKRKLYQRIRRKGSALCKLRKYRSKKLKDLCDVDSDPLMQEISNSLNVEAVRLLAAIIRNSKHKPRGRRWNFEEKILALSLLKRSPKSYILLQTLFPLPSGRTLQSLLNTIPFRTGINTHVFDALRHSLQKMYQKDRYCCLLFDEMSIRENVWFNQKFDCIEGFENLGSQGRTCNIANHALLFMVRGLHRKWKQPVAYYLSRGSTKAEMLVQCLNEVLGACQNVGLHVVATVCDMGANNVKAMKLLGSTTSEPFFQFQNQAIATIYDPPHLLKCTRNLFLKYDVQLESEHLKSQHPVAKWEHIETLYKRDRGLPIRMLFKLTDMHMAPVTQCAMKVSLAAQVMSHTVAAGLSTLVAYGKEQCHHSFCFHKK